VPNRIQRTRLKGWRMPDRRSTVYVGRPTQWGNPFKTGDRERDVALYEMQVAPTLDLSTLRGMDLVCWCGLGQTCHADVLLQLANETYEDRRMPGGYFRARAERGEFRPDWRLDPPDALAVHLRLAMHRRGIKWGDCLATDEQWSAMCTEIIDGLASDSISPLTLQAQPRAWEINKT
jgi:hypothetical protein